MWIEEDQSASIQHQYTHTRTVYSIGFLPKSAVFVDAKYLHHPMLAHKKEHVIVLSVAEKWMCQLHARAKSKLLFELHDQGGRGSLEGPRGLHGYTNI